VRGGEVGTKPREALGTLHYEQCRMEGRKHVQALWGCHSSASTKARFSPKVISIVDIAAVLADVKATVLILLADAEQLAACGWE